MEEEKKYVFWYSEDRFVSSIEDYHVEIGPPEEAKLFTRDEAYGIESDMIANPNLYDISWPHITVIGDYALRTEHRSIQYKTKIFIGELKEVQDQVDVFINSKRCLELVSVSHGFSPGSTLVASILVTYKRYV